MRNLFWKITWFSPSCICLHLKGNTVSGVRPKIRVYGDRWFSHVKPTLHSMWLHSNKKQATKTKIKRYTGHKEHTWESQGPLDGTMSLQRNKLKAPINSAWLSFIIYALYICFYAGFIILFCQIYPPHLEGWSVKILSYMKLVHGAKKVGDYCLRSKTIFILWCCEIVFVFLFFYEK